MTLRVVQLWQCTGHDIQFVVVDRSADRWSATA